MNQAEFMLLARQAGLLRRPKVGAVRSNIGAQSLGPARSVGTGNANTNWHVTTVGAAPFNAVRVHYSSSNATNGTYDATAVAASGSLTPSPHTPNGGGAWVTTGQVAVPLTGTANNPEYADTGWLSCRSVPRTDGGKYPLLLHRVWTSGALPSFSDNANPLAWDAANPDWPHRCYFQGGGNFTGSAQGSFVSTTRIGILVPSIIEFQYDSPRIRILGIGDSLMGGDSVPDGAAQRNAYGFKATRILQNQGVKLDYVNSGVAGNDFAQFGPRGKKLIDRLRPNICLIPIHTVNGAQPPTTQAAIDNMRWQAVDLAQYAANAGALPILVTPPPQNSNTLAVDGLRLQQRDWAIASGWEVFDTEPVLSTRTYPLTPCQFKPGTNGDATHYNAVGGDALGVALAALLRKLM